jgi:hypothetical protein
MFAFEIVGNMQIHRLEMFAFIVLKFYNESSLLLKPPEKSSN